MPKNSEDSDMNLSPRTLAALALLASTSAVVSHAQAAVNVNGVPSVTLTRKPTPGATKPEFTSVTLLPGRGLEVQQVTAFFPGKGPGDVNVLASPSLEESAKMLNDQDTPNGDLG
jgi:aldose 1-epimerase